MTNVVKVEGQPDRVYRQVAGLVVRRNADNEPIEIHLLLDDEDIEGGDRVEILNVLIPEECFTSP